MTLFQKTLSGIKALTGTIRHPGKPYFMLKAAKPSRAKMAQDVGLGFDSNVIMSPVRWLARAGGEAETVMRKKDGSVVETHPFLDLLENPNPFYSGAHLWAATYISWQLAGEAFWLPERNLSGRPIAFWYTPHWMIEPKWPDNGREFISHYVYNDGNGQPIKYKPDEVIHFRNGINPENTRRGLSPIAPLLSEIWTDMEAAIYVGSLLMNGGFPGLIFSPRGKGKIASTDVSTFKEYIETQFKGEGRGRPLVTSTEMRTDMFGFDPNQLDLSKARNVSEERVCAALGIPAAVVGFGTGIQQTKVGATMKELRREAWEGGVLPMLTAISAEVNRQVVPMFQGAASGSYFDFDVSDVPALAADQDAVEKRAREAFQAGAITQRQFLEETGRDPEQGQDIYLRPFSVIEVPAGGQGRVIEGEVLKRGPALIEHKEHSHSEFEHRIAEEARKLKDPPVQFIALVDRLDAIVEKGSAPFERDLVKFYKSLAQKAEEVALEVLDGKAAKYEVKDYAENRINAERIRDGMSLDGELPIFAALFEKHYFGATEKVVDAMKATLGIEAGVPDPVARSVLATAGRRAGLIDLSKQTVDSVFVTLVQAEADGIGPVAAARKIRDKVGAGPWSTEKIRASVVARTEMRFATNASVLEMGKSMKATQAIVFDARLGSTDAICEALNQSVVSLAEAEQLMFEEHPNGTRAFTPIPPGMDI